MNLRRADPTAIEIEALDGARFEAAIPGLARLLVDAVESGASVSFLAGLDQGRAVEWWARRRDAVAAGEIVPFVARENGRIVGVVLLILSTIENSPHRAEIAKVLVQRELRGRGIATRLLEAAEADAIARGRTLLVLDTVSGSTAERLYTRLGWRTVGAIPGFALDVSGRPEPATIMYKEVPRAEA